MTTDEPGAAHPEVARRLGNWSQVLNITLDVSVAVLTTLKDAAKISPVPYLPAAAMVTLSIVEVVQKMRSNKGGFKELAKYSCDTVYQIINAQKDVSHTGDVPIDLENHLEQLVKDLRSIEKFAREGASRNTLMALFRSNSEARKIQGYKQKLDHAIHVFGLQSDIILRKDVARLGRKLTASQVTIEQQLNSISSAIALSSGPSLHLSLQILTNILRKAPNDSTVVNFEALSHLENILCMDPRFISTRITDRQDKKNLIEFVAHVRHSKLLVWSRLKDGDGKAQRLLVILKRRGITTRNTYRHLKDSVSHLLKRSKKQSKE